MPLAWPLLVFLAADPVPAGPAPAGEVTGALPGQTIAVGRYHLRGDDKGGYLSETEAFVARIAPDGSVAFSDRFRLPGPVVWPVMVAAQLLQDATNGKDGAGRSTSSAYGTKIPVYNAKVPTLTLGEDDVRKDSHHAQKMSFLEATERLRARMRAAQPGTPTPATAKAEAAASGANERALESWRRRLEAVARDPGRPAADRRRTLFELWDECDGSAQGAAARTAVEATARRHFPPGHTDGYRADELATFNRGRPAAQRFDPYRPTPPRPAPRAP
jgi:hypothetical protein